MLALNHGQTQLFVSISGRLVENSIDQLQLIQRQYPVLHCIDCHCIRFILIGEVAQHALFMGQRTAIIMTASHFSGHLLSFIFTSSHLQTTQITSTALIRCPKMREDSAIARVGWVGFSFDSSR